MDNEIIERVINEIYSPDRFKDLSQVAMGAFISSLTQSNVALLEKEYERSITQLDIEVLIKLGTDITLGAYLITKYGHPELKIEVQRAIIDKYRYDYGTAHFFDIKRLVSSQAAGQFFKECTNYSASLTNTKPNLNINLGKDTSDKDIYLDFAKDNIHLTLLVGTTGSGKSVFHNNLYKGLISKNSPDTLGLVFLDMTQVDFMNWHGPYLLYPPATGDSVIGVLENIAELSKLRAAGKEGANRAIFVHIEECDMLIKYPDRTKKALQAILETKAKNNIYIMFSTSRPDPVAVVTDWLLSLTDLKVVFNLANEDDCKVLGVGTDPLSFTRPGQRLLAFNDKTIYCQPFTELEVDSLSKFTLYYLNS